MQKIHFLEALQSVKVPEKLLATTPKTSGGEGIRVYKVEANGKASVAQLSISEDKFTIYLTTEKVGFLKTTKEFTDVDIGEVERIQRGQSTIEFERAKKKSADHKINLFRSSSTGTHGAASMQPDGSSTIISSSSSTSKAASSINVLSPQRSFSIIFRGSKTLDLMTENSQARDEICNTLDNLLTAYQNSKTRVANDVLLLRYVWLAVARATRGYVNGADLAKIFNQINFAMKPKDFNANYEKFGRVIGLDRSKRRRGLTFDQSAAFLHYVRRNSWMVKPISVMWSELFGEIMNNGKKRETVSDKTFLERFLQTKQGEKNATIAQVRIIFQKLRDMEISHGSSSNVGVDRITRDQFEAYLLAEDNDAFDPVKETFNIDDMDQPLSEYFINSSHNTYLVGDQYTSHSSVEMYSQALYRGCRCLELDIWDGGKTPNGEPEPVVWHGHTMTTKIKFTDIIKTIKVFLNFHPDSFPIILSFENHCSIPYQEVMADDLVRVLGDTLYAPSENSLNKPLPSPAELQGRVVIKGRRPPGLTEELTEVDDAYNTDDDSDDEGPTSSMGDNTVTADLLARSRKKTQRNHKVSPSLARLTFFHGTKFSSWQDSVLSPFHHMHSFSENKVRSKLRHNDAQYWIMYNQTHMSRTYPAGSRVDSSNYNPLVAWSTGSQMVALNFQTEDSFLRLNDGRFRENGNCGYVLKPSTLMLKSQLSQPVPVKLSIRILSGSCLPKHKGQRTGDCISPYVKVSVFDVKDNKETSVSYPTGVAPMNGFFPIWGQEKFTFIVENSAVAMLQLTVVDKTREEFIASSSIPISCLRRGIRSVKLYDSTNTQSGAFDFASLLIDLKIIRMAAEV